MVARLERPPGQGWKLHRLPAAVRTATSFLRPGTRRDRCVCSVLKSAKSFAVSARAALPAVITLFCHIFVVVSLLPYKVILSPHRRFFTNNTILYFFIAFEIYIIFRTVVGRNATFVVFIQNRQVTLIIIIIITIPTLLLSKEKNKFPPTQSICIVYIGILVKVSYKLEIYKICNRYALCTSYCVNVIVLLFPVFFLLRIRN